MSKKYCTVCDVCAKKVEVFNNLSAFWLAGERSSPKAKQHSFWRRRFFAQGVEPWTHEGKLGKLPRCGKHPMIRSCFKPIWRRYIFVFMAVYGMCLHNVSIGTCATFVFVAG